METNKELIVDWSKHLMDDIKANYLNEKRFKCSLCKYGSFYNDHIVDHIESHHDTIDAKVKRISCRKCQQSKEHETCTGMLGNVAGGKFQENIENVSEESVYPAYLRGHQGEKSHNCKQCKKSFSRAGNLNTHIMTHNRQKLHKCSLCDKEFSQAGHLREHMMTHTGEKPHLCEQCNESFSRDDTLKRHIQSHNGEKPHPCLLCHESFSRSSHLKDHKLTHSGERPHTCEWCNRTFRRAGHLKGHMLTHTGEKAHTCKLCDKAFTVAGALKKHLMTHTGEKTHTCRQCDKQFSRAGHLKRHLLSHSQSKSVILKCRENQGALQETEGEHDVTAVNKGTSSEDILYCTNVEVNESYTKEELTENSLNPNGKVTENEEAPNAIMEELMLRLLAGPLKREDGLESDTKEKKY
jgi:KRAB domain-containing zinc finger protein